jgi:hypothetical protein
MASPVTIASASIDFVTGATPRTVNVYTVPTGYSFVLDQIDTVTTSVTNAGLDPVITFGNSGNHSAYEATHLKGTWFYWYSVPPIQQTAPAGTVITATITANSTATAQTGVVALNGYLIPATGTIPNPPTPPAPNTFFGTFFTTDPAGNVVGGVTISYALTIPQTGTGLALDANPHTVTSDNTGLVQIPMEPGATYKLWSALNAPILVTIPLTATSPYALPNWTYNS